MHSMAMGDPCTVRVHPRETSDWPGEKCDALVQPCNPAVGGPAKSQLVHEVDALGGEMGKMADKCYLQKRILNRSKVLPACALPSHSCCTWST